jgi:hypothetical protein
MWWLELILIGVVGFVAYRQHRLEQHIEALRMAYNELANLYDKENETNG